jgi:hypothetical protein
MSVLALLWGWLRALFVRRAMLAPENLALRQQLAVLQRSVPKPKLHWWDRWFWAWWSRWFSGWRGCFRDGHVGKGVPAPLHKRCEQALEAVGPLLPGEAPVLDLLEHADRGVDHAAAGFLQGIGVVGAAAQGDEADGSLAVALGLVEFVFEGGGLARSVGAEEGHRADHEQVKNDHQSLLSLGRTWPGDSSAAE